VDSQTAIRRKPPFRCISQLPGILTYGDSSVLALALVYNFFELFLLHCRQVAKYCDERVCLSAHISHEPHVHTLSDFLRVASGDRAALRYAMYFRFCGCRPMCIMGAVGVIWSGVGFSKRFVQPVVQPAAKCTCTFSSRLNFGFRWRRAERKLTLRVLILLWITVRGCGVRTPL